jgi:hypothetical protein
MMVDPVFTIHLQFHDAVAVKVFCPFTNCHLFSKYLAGLFNRCRCKDLVNGQSFQFSRFPALHFGGHRTDIGVVQLQIHGPDNIVDILRQQTVLLLAGAKGLFSPNPFLYFLLQFQIGSHHFGGPLPDPFFEPGLGFQQSQIKLNADKDHHQRKKHIGMHIDGLGDPDGFHPADGITLVLHRGAQLNPWHQAYVNQQTVHTGSRFPIDFLKRFTVLVVDRQRFIAVREGGQF